MDKGVAIQFARSSTKNTGNQPVIFEMYLRSSWNSGMQYLNQDNLSAYKEQEVLVGFKQFKVVKGKGNFQTDENDILII